jgi:hypothetical protein
MTTSISVEATKCLKWAVTITSASAPQFSLGFQILPEDPLVQFNTNMERMKR